MDTDRFDHLSRTLATRHTRRRALTHAGRGGALAALGAALGIGSMPATAQGDQTDTCTLQLVASFLVGPNQDAVLEGEVTFAMGEGGAIDDGQLVTVDEATFDLVGQATGRAISWRIETDDGPLTLLGVAQQDAILCRGAMAGTFGGPDAGSLGTWFATPPSEQGNQGSTDGRAAPAPAAAAITAAPAAPTVPPGESSESSGGGGGDTTTPDPCAASPSCGSTADGGNYVHDPVTCECGCPPGSVPCGQVCCPAGVVCQDASINECTCPTNTTLCQGTCVPKCLDGYRLDLGSCGCVTDAGGGDVDGGVIAVIDPAECKLENCASYPGYTAIDFNCQDGRCFCSYYCPDICDGGNRETYTTIACSLDPAEVCFFDNCR